MPRCPANDLFASRHVRFEYNLQGEVIATTDQNGTRHRLLRDSLGRVRFDEATPGPGVPETREFAGYRIDDTTRRIEYRYNLLGQMIDVISYDRNRGIVSRTQRRYHRLTGQPIRDVQDTRDTNRAGVRYHYNPYGHLLKMEYPWGDKASYLYGYSEDNREHEAELNRALGRPSAISLAGREHVQYRYFGAGSVASVRLPYTENIYDPHCTYRGPITQMLGSPDEPFEYLDTLGQTTVKRWARGNTAVSPDEVRYITSPAQVRLARAQWVDEFDQRYDYDALNRLVKLYTGPGQGEQDLPREGSEHSSMTWKLDATGNWRELDSITSESAESLTLTHNKLNQITSIETEDDAFRVTLQYDKAGNAVVIPQPEDRGKPFYCTYDAWNRLVAVARDGSAGKRIPVARYVYDGLGRRLMKKTFDTAGKWEETRAFYYSPNWQVLEEWIRRADLKKDTFYLDRTWLWGLQGQDNPIAFWKRGEKEPFYPLQDANGNVTSLMTWVKNLDDQWRFGPVERYVYDPYGRPFFREPGYPYAVRSASAYGLDVLYAGYRYDAETGLYHVRRRMLHPTLGVWLTPDPQGYADSFNLYQYCGGSPLSYTDPSGEVVITLSALGLIALYGALTGAGLGAAAYTANVAFSEGGLEQNFAWGELWKSVGIGAAAGAVAGLTYGVATPLLAGGLAGGAAATKATAGVAAILGSTLSGAAAGTTQGYLGGTGAYEGALYGAMGGVVGGAAFRHLGMTIRGVMMSGAAAGFASGGSAGAVSGYATDGMSGALRGGIVGGLFGAAAGAAGGFAGYRMAALGWARTPSGRLLVGVPRRPYNRMVRQLRALQAEEPVVDTIELYGSRTGSPHRGRGPLSQSDLDMSIRLHAAPRSEQRGPMIRALSITRSAEREMNFPVNPKFHRTALDYAVWKSGLETPHLVDPI